MNTSCATMPLSAVVLSMTATAWAQTPSMDLPLPNILISAPPIIESNAVDSHAGFSTLVTDRQIQRLGALDLAAALRMTPGVQISRYNEVGSYSGDQGGNVYIRGTGASRPGGEIKTYLDGIPVYMGLWGHPLMDLLPVHAMKSIEVHKGPQNQVNGNNFGSINLVSRRATRDGVHGEVQASFGTQSTKVLQGQLQAKQQGMDVALALGHMDSNGHRPNGDSRLNHAMGRIQQQIAGAWSLGASFLSIRNEVGDPGDNRHAVSSAPVGPYAFSNGVGRNDSATNLITVFAEHAHDQVSGSFTAYANDGRNNLVNDANWGTFDSAFNMRGFRWKEVFRLWGDAEIQWAWDQDIVSGKVSGPHTGSAVGTPFGFMVPGQADVPNFRVSSMFAGWSQSWALSPSWTVKPSVGARAYDSTFYAGKVAPQVGVSFARQGLTVHAHHALGLLYPGAETYTLTRAIPMAFAADNGWERLSPSENLHTEFGVLWSPTPSTQLDVSVFQDDISKRYVWPGFYASAIATPASGTWSNAYPDYTTRGVELAWRQQLGRGWSMFMGVTTLDSTLSDLPYAPETAVSLGVSGVAWGVRINLDGQYQTDMQSQTQDRGTYAPQAVESFAVANARLAWPVAALGSQGEVHVAVSNVFDAPQTYNAGYPLPGRTLRVGLRANF